MITPRIVAHVFSLGDVGDDEGIGECHTSNVLCDGTLHQWTYRTIVVVYCRACNMYQIAHPTSVYVHRSYNRDEDGVVGESGRCKNKGYECHDPCDSV